MKHFLITAIVGGLSLFIYSFSSIFGAEIALAALGIFGLCAFARLWAIRKSKKGVHGYLKDKANLRKRFSESA